VDALASAQPVPRSSRTDLIRRVLDHIDGIRTQRDIVAKLRDRVGVEFASQSDLEGFVRRVVMLNRTRDHA
jgi:hypothetical protein